jgi:hypothetical protein
VDPAHPSLAEPLTDIAGISRELVDSMSDIVWAIDPERDHLGDLVHRMRRFASDVFSPRDIRLEFQSPAGEQDLPMGADLRRQIFLVFKEAVHNVLRHSGATEVSIDFQVEHGWLHLRVADKGRGFDAAQGHDGHGLRSMQERVRPGMTEGEVFGIVHEAVLKAGGEMGMIQIGSCSMLDPDINDQRPRPVERIIGERDIINNELGIFYNGYEAQCGRPVVTGEPTAEYQEMFEIAKEGYRRLVPTLYAGKSSEDSIQAMQFIRDTEYEFYGGFLQGMLGANPRHEPQIGFDRVQSAEDRFLFGVDGYLVYEVGHVFTLQMHIVDRKHIRGLFVAIFCDRRKRTALLEQIAAGDDANTTVVAQSC